MMTLIRHILSFLLFFTVSTASAQATMQSNNTQVEKWRKNIDLDYTVPDYNVKKPDAKVMGWRLAKILQSLEQNYTQGIYSHYLMTILSHQRADAPLYMPIRKLTILNIQKQDCVITIRIGLFSKTKESGKVKEEILLSFVNGISEDDIANTLFSELGQYIRKKN